MTLQTLYALGAPELPPNHFYRVGTDSFGFVTVEVREKTKRFSRRISSAIVTFRPDHDADGRDTVVRGCKSAFREAGERRQSWAAYAEITDLEGDHF